MRVSVGIAVSMLAACGAAPAGGRPTQEASHERRPVAVGDTLASFQARRLDVPSTSLTIPSGTVMLVAFLATWSEPDKKSVPKLQELHLKYGGRGLVVVDVGIDDEVANVLEFARTYGARFPVVWDEGHAFAARVWIETDPCYLIVDARGIVRFVHRGYHEDDEAAMDREIAGLLPR